MAFDTITPSLPDSCRAFLPAHPKLTDSAGRGPPGKPAKMHHLCKNMQKAVQDTAGRLLAIIGISGPSLSSTTPVPVIDPPFMIKAVWPQAGSRSDGPVMHHIHKEGQPQGPRPFLHRVHRALISLGPWEGRIVAFVLGAAVCFL